MKPRLRYGLALLVSVGLLVAGCGDSGGETTTTESVGGTTTESPTTASGGAADSETLAAYQGVADIFNEGSGNWSSDVGKAQGKDGDVELPLLQGYARDYRDAVFEADAELREVDLTGFEEERNAMLEGFGELIAGLDALSTATTGTDAGIALGDVNESGAQIGEISAELLSALEGS